MFSETKRINCPYCGEAVEILIDASVESQAYIEDCSVCCRPIELCVTIGMNEVDVIVRREDD